MHTKEEYEITDRAIQRENMTRRLPEHLDDEDKKQFELIRQGSSMKNEDFYHRYIEPETMDVMRRESSDGTGAKAEFKLDDLDYEEIESLDEFDDDLDSLLLSTPSIPTLTRDR